MEDPVSSSNGDDRGPSSVPPTKTNDTNIGNNDNVVRSTIFTRSKPSLHGHSNGADSAASPGISSYLCSYQ